MPPSHDILTDDYVADLLAKEASDCSLKYSARGLEAFNSNKRPANQPKPNTRFLNNIIRDTNSHNRALRAKENAESQARLRDLEEAERRKRDEDERRERRSKPGPDDTRKRMLGDIAAILGGPSKKRRRPNEGDNKSTSIASDRDELDSGRDRDRKGKSRETRYREDDVRSKKRSRRDDQYSDSRDRHRHSHRHEERRRSRRSSSSEEPKDRRREHRERTHREKDDVRGHHRRLEKEEINKPSSRKDTDSDSDPLDDLIGPAPPSKSIIRRRGRGLNAAMSGIDGRFAADYDPTIDVTPDPDEAGGNDWDNAVEAFRDRQKWKQQGAERLRSAGFTEEQIKKWEKGDKKDESDVQWNKAGGVREWDRGKVVDTDSGLSPENEFGRLKGT
ncbi:hypothetical protein EKO27_g9762 [Xylaria grammica]|uniref:Pre-mRNA-splicing factor 38B n=1 Tax=Xylaria grammica TaxID=363999 RepID=A0A439CT68_9PEZI|nr:hypothetical protein EKO27_g9762 [Xylaria grammica]